MENKSGLTVAKSVNFRLSGEDFFMISISKWCYCNSPVFHYMPISYHEFWWHRWKFTSVKNKLRKQHYENLYSFQNKISCNHRSCIYSQVENPLIQLILNGCCIFDWELKCIFLIIEYCFIGTNCHALLVNFNIIQ